MPALLHGQQGLMGTFPCPMSQKHIPRDVEGSALLACVKTQSFPHAEGRTSRKSQGGGLWSEQRAKGLSRTCLPVPSSLRVIEAPRNRPGLDKWFGAPNAS